MGSVTAGVLQLLALIGALALAYIPLGHHMARVYCSDRHWRVERWIYKGIGADPDTEMRWPAYLRGVLAFSVAGVLFLYLLQRLQGVLPGSLGFRSIDPDQAFNTAVSFVTNTNWQSYYGEQAMGHVVQTAGLAVQNFVSAAVGIAVAVALVRGFARSRTGELGNFWADLVRGVVRVLVPLAVIAAVVLVACGALQNFSGIHEVGQFMGGSQQWNGGAVASQEAIKELGTNGGGVLNANSAHPFENPDEWSNLIEIFLLLVIPVALTRTFGQLVGNRKQGYVLLSVMGLIWGAMLAVIWAAEANGLRPLEGKELRFGIPASALFANSTTGTSTGAINSLHDSFTGLGGGGTMLNMLFGEMTPGGVGTGLYSILVMAIIAMFLAGLMVGRTPEYLGKKLGRKEVTAAAVSILAMPTVLLIGAGIAAILPSTQAALNNPGSHGLSEILYAYASASNNNGSAFAGITVTNDWFQASLGICMAFGRFIPIIAVLALAGSLAAQKKVPVTAGTLPTTGPLFATLLGGSIVLVAALTFVPALALGPIAEALL